MTCTKPPMKINDSDMRKVVWFSRNTRRRNCARLNQSNFWPAEGSNVPSYSHTAKLGDELICLLCTIILLSCVCDFSVYFCVLLYYIFFSISKWTYVVFSQQDVGCSAFLTYAVSIMSPQPGRHDHNKCVHHWDTIEKKDRPKPPLSFRIRFPS